MKLGEGMWVFLIQEDELHFGGNRFEELLLVIVLGKFPQKVLVHLELLTLKSCVSVVAVRDRGYEYLFASANEDGPLLASQVLCESMGFQAATRHHGDVIAETRWVVQKDVVKNRNVLTRWNALEDAKMRGEKVEKSGG